MSVKPPDVHWPTYTDDRADFYVEIRCVCGERFDAPSAWWGHAVAAERARIVEALAAIHWKCENCWDDRPTYWMCAECGSEVDADGDCPTMRIAKGKP